MVILKDRFTKVSDGLGKVHVHDCRTCLMTLSLFTAGVLHVIYSCETRCLGTYVRLGFFFFGTISP